MLIISLIILQVIIFAALIFALKKILSQNVVSATQHLDEMSQTYKKKEEEINKRIEEVRKESELILAKAGEEAEKLRAEIVGSAEFQKEKILKEAHIKSNEMVEQADKSRQLLLSEINDRITRESITRACELIKDVLPEQFRKEVHADWVEELMGGSFGRLDNLRIAPDIHEVKVVSAFPLADAQRKALSKKLRDVIDKEINLKEDTDPALVAGIIVTIGSLVLDGSFRNRIIEKAKNAQHSGNE